METHPKDLGYIYNPDKKEWWLATNEGMTSNQNEAYLYTREYFAHYDSHCVFQVYSPYLSAVESKPYTPHGKYEALF